jgi:hypothetical protein
MKKMKLQYISLLVLIAVVTACTDKFDEFNTDNKRPTEVPGSALFTSGQKALADQISTPNVNLNVWRLFAQYWTETTYTDEANYNIVDRTIPDNTFEAYYMDIIRDFDEARRLYLTEEITDANTAADVCNKRQICELMMVYAYQDLVDIFGNVPYFEAMDITNLHPSYNIALDIYQDLIDRVDAALDSMEVTGNEGLGTADIIYSGDVAQWIKFANSMKIKLGIVLSDTLPDIAQQVIESAVDGAFTSNADNALFGYQGASPNANQIYAELILTGRHDFVAANTIVDIMNGLEDPRLSVYFTLADTSTDPEVEKLAYIGGDYGYSSPFSQYSHVSDIIQKPMFPGIIMTYDEIAFYLAEAAAREYNVGATAEELYNRAITASFDFWQTIPGAAALWDDTPTVEDYLVSTGVQYDQDHWKELIGTQSWLAFYTRGLEGYTQWRRLDYPIFNIAEAITDYSEIPTRFTYPVIEQTVNGDNYYEAADAIGGDELTTKLFWDIH